MKQVIKEMREIRGYLIEVGNSFIEMSDQVIDAAEVASICFAPFVDAYNKQLQRAKWREVLTTKQHTLGLTHLEKKRLKELKK